MEKHLFLQSLSLPINTQETNFMHNKHKLNSLNFDYKLFFNYKLETNHHHNQKN